MSMSTTKTSAIWIKTQRAGRRRHHLHRPEHRRRIGNACGSRRRLRFRTKRLLRYSRHLILPEVGMEGQLKLKKASVAADRRGRARRAARACIWPPPVSAASALSISTSSMFSNLQRQVIHGTSDVGRKKLDSAADKMQDINPHLKIDKYDVALTSENALDILRGLRHRHRRHRQFSHALSGE